MHDLGSLALLFAFLGGIGGGFVNSVAGGGTLVTFPVLTAIGIPSLDANITNAVALSPGYAGGVLAQRDDFGGRRDLARTLAITAICGGITGGVLLLVSGEYLFTILVPWLILFATALLAFQGPLRRLTASARGVSGEARTAIILIPIFAATVYGGYFGAGLGIVTIAILNLLLSDTLNRLNALKLLMSLAANGAAALLFAFSGHVYWAAGVLMGVGAWGGGWAGGKSVQHIPERPFRWGIITLGLAMTIVFFLRI